MPPRRPEQEEEQPVSPGRQALLWVSYAAIGLLIFGALYQLGASTLADANHPPPGEMVDLGGFELHIHCIGEGEVTVLFEPGLGDMGHAFSRLQEELATDYRACVYDRLGLGWSDRARAPRTVGALANNELAVLLERANVPGPYVLVAHSFGGLVALEFAGNQREQVAGMVLLDSLHPAEHQERAPLLLRSSVHIFRAATLVGITRIIWRSGQPAPETEADEAALATMLRTKHLWSYTDYLEMILRHPGGEYRPLRSGLPLLVLSADHGEETEMGGFYRQQQEELAARSDAGEHRVVPGTGHYIYRDRPDAVLEAIEDVIQAAAGEVPPPDQPTDQEMDED